MRRHLAALSVLLAVGGALGEGRAPDRVYDLIDVSWKLSFAFDERRIQGDVTNTLRPLQDGVSELPFHSAKLTIGKVTVDGASASWRQEGETLWVRLGRPASKSGEIKVRIVYSGKPEAGLYFVPADRAYPAKTPMVYTQGETEDNRHWLPTWDYPNDKATSEGFIEAPNGWFVLSNGRLVESTARKDKVVFHWKMEQPHVTYLIALVAGPYSEGRETWGDLPVLHYVPIGLESWGRSSFGGTSRMVQFFCELTGFKYPYAKFAQSVVADFMFGGMENITMVTNTIGTLHPPHEKPFADSEGLVLHELAHQWFGDTTTCLDWSHIWLNEGFASFLPAFYVRAVRGEEAFDLARVETLSGAFEAAAQSKRPMVSTDYELPIDMFDGNAYAGGAARLYMLMRKVGEDAFWKGVQRFLKEKAFQNVTTEEFFEVLSASTGQDLDAFRKQWFTRAGAPALTLARSGASIVIKQAAPGFDLDTELWVLDGDKWIVRSVAVRGAETTVALGELAGKPCLLDPQVWLMADVRYDLGYDSDAWTSLYRRAPNAAQKVRLLEAMRKAGKRDLIALLALEEESARVLQRMIGDLGSASKDFVLKLARHPDRLVQQAAVRALGRLPKTEDAVARLAEIWQRDRSDLLRRDALEALVSLTGDESLLEAAWERNSFQDTLRQFALSWWTAHKPDVARSRCLEVLRSPRSEALRVTAIGYLGSLKDLPGKREVFHALMEVLREDSIGGRSAAIRALQSYGDSEAIPELKKLEDFGFYGIRRAAQEALKALGAGGRGVGK